MDNTKLIFPETYRYEISRVTLDNKRIMTTFLGSDGKMHWEIEPVDRYVHEVDECKKRVIINVQPGKEILWEVEDIW